MQSSHQDGRFPLKEHWPPFLRYLLNSVMSPFVADPVDSPLRACLARQKVGDFAFLAAVKAKQKSKKERSNSLSNSLE